MFRVLGISLVALAIALAVIPQFTDCQSQGHYATLANGNTTSMKCHWTAMSQIAVAIPLAFVGTIMATTKRKKNALGLGVLGVVLGIMPILLTTQLIGTRSNPTMYCNTAMKPALFMLGGFISVVSLGAVIASYRDLRQP